MENIQNCYSCKHLGWENVGEGLNPICEKDSKYADKSRPTVVDFNKCKLFEKRSKSYGNTQTINT